MSRDLFPTVATIKKMYKMWIGEQSIWSTWMRGRYIKGKSLEELLQSTNHKSPIWTPRKRIKQHLDKCIRLDSNYSWR